MSIARFTEAPPRERCRPRRLGEAQGVTVEARRERSPSAYLPDPLPPQAKTKAAIIGSCVNHEVRLKGQNNARQRGYFAALKLVAAIMP